MSVNGKHTYTCTIQQSIDAHYYQKQFRLNYKESFETQNVRM